MDLQKLETTAKAMVAPEKGILAMDESSPTCAKRFQAVGVADTIENRAAYRTLLIGTPGLGQYISGAILYDETIRQTSTEGGLSFPDLMRRQDIIIGIKVDAGAKDMAGHPGEKITEGLDRLRERLAEYVELGARFSKWRAVITIGQGLPSRACIEANAHALARYAMLCQEAGLVPIVEPEVLIDGDHTIERCYEVTLETQRCVFEQLYRQGVAFSGMVLKPSMVISGKSCPQRAPVEAVAEQTIRCVRNTVPVAVPGMAFLSGGQSEEEATAHLNAMNVMAEAMHLPWRLTFSYARALQHSALARWKGDAANVEAARSILLHRARLNSLASAGRYQQAMEQEAA
ncbi:MAG: fructose-bisphosphate aldolase class I [Thiogranum sp.]|nr:fructose-bisphosphate aldolase class I [Thiogranum sp.]